MQINNCGDANALSAPVGFSAALRYTTWEDDSKEEYLHYASFKSMLLRLVVFYIGHNFRIIKPFYEDFSAVYYPHEAERKLYEE